MPIQSGAYGYVVVRGDWILQEPVQLLLALGRTEATKARSSGFHLMEARILDDGHIGGLLAEVHIAHSRRNGEAPRMIAAQVLVPWAAVVTVVCFSEEHFGEVKTRVGFRMHEQE